MMALPSILGQHGSRSILKWYVFAAGSVQCESAASPCEAFGLRSVPAALSTRVVMPDGDRISSFDPPGSFGPAESESESEGDSGVSG